MQTKCKRPAATLRRRETGQRRDRKYFRRSYGSTTHPKISTELARRILNAVGLAFEKVPGTNFHRFAPARSQGLETAV